LNSPAGPNPTNFDEEAAMADFKIVEDGTHACRMTLLQMAVDLLKETDWVNQNPETIAKKIKAAVDQLAQSYQQL
jgi:hypothetical protein